MLGRQKRKVRMHLKDGPSIEGVLAGRTRHEFVLWAPRIITDAETDAEVDVSGHVEVPHANVLYYQVIG